MTDAKPQETPNGDTRRTDGAPPRRRAWLTLVPLVVFGALAAVFLLRIYQSGRDTSFIPSALIGAPAPEFDLPPLDGLKVAAVPGAPAPAEPVGSPVPGLTRTDLNGKVTLVNVWASWCIPCREEHPFLERLAGDGRFRLVGINYKDKGENALRFLDEFGNPYAAVGVDANGRTGIDWGVYGVPETFIVGPDGTIVDKIVGPISEDTIRDRIEPALTKALARPAA